MIALVLTIIFSTLIILLFRLVDKYNVDELGTIAFNYLFATTFGLLVWRNEQSISELADKHWIGPALLIGVLFIVTFFLLSKSTARTGMAITAVASRMSVLIPVIAGFFLFNDSASIVKLSGIGLAIGSFYLVMKPKGELKLDWKFAILPLLLLIGIGVNDTAMKYLQHHYFNGDESQFLTVVFFVAFVIGSVVLSFRSLKKKQFPRWSSVFLGFLLGLLNFGSTYFLIISMSNFESSVLFPIVNMSVVVLSAITGLILFHEKLSKMNWFGIGLAIIAILMITSSN